MSTFQYEQLMFTPVPWRKVTPLHSKLGARAARLVYASGVNAPTTAAPLTINFRYGPEAAMDRIVGFNVMLGAGADSPELTISELATGWFFDRLFVAGQGAMIYGNIETLPDMVDLKIAFAAATTRNVYISLFNFEVVPGAW
jgi:hypothetical protein